MWKQIWQTFRTGHMASVLLALVLATGLLALTNLGTPSQASAHVLVSLQSCPMQTCCEQMCQQMTEDDKRDCKQMCQQMTADDRRACKQMCQQMTEDDKDACKHMCRQAP